MKQNEPSTNGVHLTNRKRSGRNDTVLLFEKYGATRSFGGPPLSSKALGEMTKYICIAAIIISTLIAIRSKLVWDNCGYDCGIISVTQGPAAIVGWYISLAAIIISIATLFTSYIRNN